MNLDTRQQLSPSVGGKHAAEMESDRRRRLVLTICVLVLATLALSSVAAGPGVLPGDVWIARQVQRVPAGVANAIAGAVYWLGSVPALAGGALLIGGALALRHRWVESVLVISTVPVRGVNPILKRLLNSPRPPEELVSVTEQARGMGFPSGHSMGVALLYGLSAFLLSRLVSQASIRVVMWLIAVGMIGATGFGRIYTGAHWPSDVLGGYLWASIVALVMLGIAKNAIPPAPTILAGKASPARTGGVSSAGYGYDDEVEGEPLRGRQGDQPVNRGRLA